MTNKQAIEPKRQWQHRANQEVSHIGPLPTKVFHKMQIILGNCTESERYECLYNILVMMIEED
jgi:hypothetical protein